jgi:hypothetical protein
METPSISLCAMLERIEARLEMVLRRAPVLQTFGHYDVSFSLPTVLAALASDRLLPLLQKAVENDLVDVNLCSEAGYLVVQKLNGADGGDTFISGGGGDQEKEGQKQQKREQLTRCLSPLAREIVTRAMSTALSRMKSMTTAANATSATSTSLPMGTRLGKQQVASSSVLVSCATLFFCACHFGHVDIAREMKARIEQTAIIRRTGSNDTPAAPTAAAAAATGIPCAAHGEADEEEATTNKEENKAPPATTTTSTSSSSALPNTALYTLLRAMATPTYKQLESPLSSALFPPGKLTEVGSSRCVAFLATRGEAIVKELGMSEEVQRLLFSADGRWMAGDSLRAICFAEHLKLPGRMLLSARDIEQLGKLADNKPQRRTFPHHLTNLKPT